jgi:DnaJ like chaperone protein
LEELKASYRIKIKQYHPDRVAGLGEEFVVLARDKSQRLNQAYEEAKRIIALTAPSNTTG